jgi:hypothetical protein
LLTLLASALRDATATPWGGNPTPGKGSGDSVDTPKPACGGSPFFTEIVEKPMSPKQCPECGSPLPTAKTTGRPATYCTPVCRRAAEFALRRAQVLLTRAQRGEQDAALAVATGSNYQAADNASRLAFWRLEVQRLKEEIRALLAGAGDENETQGAAPTPQRP